MSSLAFLLGLLALGAPAFVTGEDIDGPHKDALATWQALGFIGREPGVHPHPTCPHCAEGVPYRAEGRLLCSGCRCVLPPRELLAWPVHREAFLTALATHLGLRGGVRSIDAQFWELGSGNAEGSGVVGFFHADGPLSDPARTKFALYRRVLVLSAAPGAEHDGLGRWVPLTAVLDADGAFARIELPDLLRQRGRVRFDRETGGLRVGATLVGEIPPGGREWAFLACLAEHLDQFVPYTDLKWAVLRETGGSGETDEATFCQKLKSRIKEKYVPRIDHLIATTNKGDGYRLRAEGEA